MSEEDLAIPDNILTAMYEWGALVRVGENEDNYIMRFDFGTVREQFPLWYRDCVFHTIRNNEAVLFFWRMNYIDPVPDEKGYLRWILTPEGHNQDPLVQQMVMNVILRM